MSRILSLILLLLMLSVGAFSQVSPVPPLMTFQGRLAKPDGTPVADGNYNLQLSLYNALSGGTLWWQRNVINIPVKNGVFAARLDFSGGYQNGATQSSLFGASAVYLEISINGGAPLTPRQQVVTVAYAMKADSVKDGAITGASIADGTITAADIASQGFNTLAWLLGGNSGTNPATQFIGTTDNQPLNFRVNNLRGLLLEWAIGAELDGMNVLGGHYTNFVTAGATVATIAGGGYRTVEGMSIILANNRVTDTGGTVGGGADNRAGNSSGTPDDARFATIAGGLSNLSGSDYASVGGGYSNEANGDYSTVAGGRDNLAGANYTTIGGGISNAASDFYTTVAGGSSNTAANDYAAVSGGYSNFADGQYSVIGGGYNNTIGTGADVNYAATIAGGSGNLAERDYATVGGGSNNVASGDYATVPGRYR